MLQDKKLIERNLQENARGCQWLVLWLDCDREGENIAFEVDMLSVSSEMPATIVKRNFLQSGITFSDLQSGE